MRINACPNCNARIKSQSGCYRCGFDFTRLIHCEETAFRHYREAIIHLKSGRPEQALEFCSLSAHYENTERVQALKRLILLKSLYHGQKEV